MQGIVNEKVSVISVYDKNKGTSLPVKLYWQGKVRVITKIGFHHSKWEGRKLIHFFSVADRSLCYFLSLDTENLHWSLLEVSDGSV